MDREVKEIKEIAKKFSPEQIDACINQQIDTGENICLKTESAEQIINELAKARVVRGFMDKGISLADALRELARRMRLIQKGFEGEEK